MKTKKTERRQFMRRNNCHYQDNIVLRNWVHLELRYDKVGLYSTIMPPVTSKEEKRWVLQELEIIPDNKIKF